MIHDLRTQAGLHRTIIMSTMQVSSDYVAVTLTRRVLHREHPVLDFE